MNFKHTSKRKSFEKIVKNIIKSFNPSADMKEELLGKFYFDKLATSGLIGHCLSSEVGGNDGDIADAAIITEQLSKYSLSLATIYLVNSIFSGYLISIGANVDMRKRLLTKLVKGESKFAFALTEPEAGSDARNISTLATPVCNGYQLSGTKHYITGANIADYIIVVALKFSEENDRDVAIFVVPRATKGLKITVQPKKSSNVFASCKLELDDVFVEKKNVIGDYHSKNEGWGLLKTTGALERLLVAVSCYGSAQTIYERTLSFAKNRVQFGKAISEFQVIQHRLVEMATKVQSMRWMALQPAFQFSKCEIPIQQISMAKIYCSESLVEIAQSALKIYGGRACFEEEILSELYNESVIGLFAGGTNEIQKNIIAKTIGI